MKSVQIGNDLNNEKTILICIFWATRKTKTLEGCAPLFICKIITCSKTYIPISKKRLKLTLSIISDIQKDLNHFKPSEIEIAIGNELLNVYFNKETFYVNTRKNKDLENEITEKLELEFDKKNPRICNGFIPKILAH